MIDKHVHIGQFKDIYYKPQVILSIVLEAGIDELFFSSTTTCRDNIRYIEIETEINTALSQIGSMAEKTHPLLWCIPDYIKQGISIDSIMRNLPYHGIKIHPFAQFWDLTNTGIIDLIHNLFDYANQNELPVLIHTGEDTICEANKFSVFYAEYPKAQFILAHGRPIKQTIHLLQTFKNVYCDTAFMPFYSFKRIIDKKLAHKIVLGSDFPITHYFSFGNIANEWKTQYEKDLAIMNYYNSICFIDKR